MIDDKINNSLRQLEQGLINIESARKQVEKTVKSYDGLNKTTGEYVTKLGNLTSKVQELADSIRNDYQEKVRAFEKDRNAIINTSNAAIEKLTKATEMFKDSLSEIKTKLKYNIIINVVSLLAIITIIIILFLTR